jgi:hypothetical protein
MPRWTSTRKNSPSRQLGELDAPVLRENVFSIARTLHDAMTVSITCENALCHMNGEDDRYVARILRRHASGKVCGAIGELAVLSARLQGIRVIEADDCKEVDKFLSRLDAGG